MTPADIYEVLTAQKVYLDGQWYIVDEKGELVPNTLMWRANPGALLMWPRQIEVEPLPPVSGVSQVSGSGRSKRPLPEWLDNQSKLAKLHADDQIVTELLVSLVTKGFFHDYST